MFFREMLEESSCRVPNGAVSAVPKLLQSVIDHNPNAFGSPSKPKVIGMFNCFSVMLFAIFLLNLNSAVPRILCNVTMLTLPVLVLLPLDGLFFLGESLSFSFSQYPVFTYYGNGPVDL